MKNSKKLIAAVAALVVALAVSVGSTFAWFTQQSYVDVTGVEANVVKASTDLQVRQVKADGSPVDGRGFTYSLDLKFDGTYGDGTTLINKAFELKDYTYKTDKGAKLYARGSDDNVAETETAVDGGGFIQFFLQFKSSEAVDIQLTSNGTSVTSTGTPNGDIIAWGNFNNTYGPTIDLNDILKTDASNAARIAFLPMTTASVASDLTLEEGLIWDPAYGDDETEGKGFYKGNLAHDYEKQLKGDAFVEYETADDNDVTLDDTTIASTKKANISLGDDKTDTSYYTFVCVRIWIEGRDGDCFNYILGDTLNVKFQFKAKEEATSNGPAEEVEEDDD